MKRNGTFNSKRNGIFNLKKRNCTFNINGTFNSRDAFLYSDHSHAWHVSWIISTGHRCVQIPWQQSITLTSDGPLSWCPAMVSTGGLSLTVWNRWYVAKSLNLQPCNTFRTKRVQSYVMLAKSISSNINHQWSRCLRVCRFIWHSGTRHRAGKNKTTHSGFVCGSFDSERTERVFSLPSCIRQMWLSLAPCSSLSSGSWRSRLSCPVSSSCPVGKSAGLNTNSSTRELDWLMINTN